MHIYKAHVLVCDGKVCSSSKSGLIIEEFNKQLISYKLDKDIQVISANCFDLCTDGPVVAVYPEGAMYFHVNVKDVKEIVNEHLKNGRIVKRLLMDDSIINKDYSADSSDFFKNQKRIALRNCGRINPEDIEEYIAYDGYKALGKVLTEMKPIEVIDMVKKSGLRGRGGAGFLTGQKWLFGSLSKSDEKFVCCNADEGDPGAFMDRSILEGDPHSVIEAMAIAGYAIGSNEGAIYVRAEYPTAVKRLKIAIDEAKKLGLLGKNIINTGFNFDLHIRLGAGAFVCGEETALMTSIEGHR